MAAIRYPFLRPNPPRLSRMSERLAAIEESGIFSNYGPVNSKLEAAFVSQIFGGEGACLTVCNATLGLMLAIRAAVGWRGSERRYAIMPSFTFAATAHAALWCGLTPLLCDVEPDTWMADPESERALLERYKDEVAVIVPYATLGNCLDTTRYDRISETYGVPVVIDAAASLGSLDEDGRGYGTGSRHPVIFSLHVTKTFSTSEAGLIYCADPARIEMLRAMANFGFGQPRCATMPGLNAKLSEIGALLGLAKLEEFEPIVAHRERLAAAYMASLPGFSFQRMIGQRHAYQFMPVLLPDSMVPNRDKLSEQLVRRGIGSGRYFSPHLAEQPYFRETCITGELPVTQMLASRIFSLPMADGMNETDVRVICDAIRETCRSLYV